MKKPPDEFHGFPIDAYDALPQTADVASATECTGLMPALPGTAGEYEAYRSLHTTSLPKEAGRGAVAPAMEAVGQTARRSASDGSAADRNTTSPNTAGPGAADMAPPAKAPGKPARRRRNPAGGLQAAPRQDKLPPS